MFYYHLPAAFIIAFIVVLFIALYTHRRLRALWITFLVIFLISWSGQLWIKPFGPTFLGIAWLPLFIVAFTVGLLFLSLAPQPLPKQEKEVNMAEVPLIVLGSALWIVLILLMLSVVFGYLRIPFVPPKGAE